MSLAFILVVGLCIRIFTDIEGRFGYDAAVMVMGFQGPSQVVGVSIVCALFVVSAFLAVTAYQAATRRLDSTMRLVRTSEMPDLSLVRNMRFHLFVHTQ